jgi:thioesterase domain-containing protein
VQFVHDFGLGTLPTDRLRAELSNGHRNDQMNYLLTVAQQANILPPGFEVSVLESLFNIFRNNIKAACQYQPQSYSGPATLFVAQDRESMDAHAFNKKLVKHWKNLISNLEVHEVGADHYSILQEPSLSVIAASLRTSL